MRTIRILAALLGFIAVALLGGCGVGSDSVAAELNPQSVGLPEAPAFPPFTPNESGDLGLFVTEVTEWRDNVGEWRDEVRAQAVGLSGQATEDRDATLDANAAAEKSAIAKATDAAAAARSEADAKAKREALAQAKANVANATSLDDIRVAASNATAKLDATLDANAAAEKSAIAKATDAAADARSEADAKARSEYRKQKEAITAELSRVEELADSDLRAADRLFGNDELQQQVDVLQQRVVDLERAPASAPVAVPCAAQPAFTG